MGSRKGHVSLKGRKILNIQTKLLPNPYTHTTLGNTTLDPLANKCLGSKRTFEIDLPPGLPSNMQENLVSQQRHVLGELEA